MPIAQSIAQLSDYGFDPRQCEDALRVANYDIDFALDLLLTGSVAQPPQLRPMAPPQRRSPQLHQFGSVQKVYDSLSQRDQAAVLRLVALHPDPETVIQLFMACDRNEEQTLGLLSEHF
jgi:hypothetical protein